MQRTIFDTPILRHILPAFGRLILRIFGWKIEGEFPNLPKYVLIGAPHTSNWDFPIGMAICFAREQKVYWMGKHTLFAGPLGPLSRWLGGIPVDRRKSNSLVEQMVQVFGEHEQLVVAIPPEGTRKKVEKWKTGFYYIALGSQLPIVLGYIDFGRKMGGCGEVFYPTGDIEADMAKIRAFYTPIVGKRPENQ
ncbi:lysophospholipid acyltransferase family protein [Chitinibacter bivalviorum]|uniref:Lysophospholipid acyltransferase family protein n=1 Tax=Chitinibacter bivalviorum TaxID=2739434 RepID=A0A7H9BF83_9NEIS|nr:lysophospholipid acyltransferase family protein [Chitinibacter bivalviorum]QLG87363.1 lysophospholipid acyltransferase family protein [Chitinibacter bivalviorum]